MSETNGPPKLPEGYRLDLADDPDAPALRRPDGTVVARFGARGMTHQAVEREALEDLLLTSRKLGAGTPSQSRRYIGHDLRNALHGKPLTANFLELRHGEVRRNNHPCA